MGIDIEPINESAEGTEFGSLVTQELPDISAGVQAAPGEWIARCKAAQEAAARAGGPGPGADRLNARVTRIDVNSGEVFVALHAAGEPTAPSRARVNLRVQTAKRGNHVWAWTLGMRE